MAPIGPIVGAIAGVASITQGIRVSRTERQNAAAATQIAGIEADRIRREGRRALGERAAQFGASGVVLGEGTPLDVLADQAAEIEEEALLRQLGGQFAARNARIRADQAFSEGILGGLGNFAEVGSQVETLLSRSKGSKAPPGSPAGATGIVVPTTGGGT